MKFFLIIQTLSKFLQFNYITAFLFRLKFIKISEVQKFVNRLKLIVKYQNTFDDESKVITKSSIIAQPLYTLLTQIFALGSQHNWKGECTDLLLFQALSKRSSQIAALFSTALFLQKKSGNQLSTVNFFIQQALLRGQIMEMMAEIYSKVHIKKVLNIMNYYNTTSIISNSEVFKTVCQLTEAFYGVSVEVDATVFSKKEIYISIGKEINSQQQTTKTPQTNRPTEFPNRQSFVKNFFGINQEIMNQIQGSTENQKLLILELPREEEVKRCVSVTSPRSGSHYQSTQLGKPVVKDDTFTFLDVKQVIEYKRKQNIKKQNMLWEGTSESQDSGESVLTGVVKENETDEDQLEKIESAERKIQDQNFEIVCYQPINYHSAKNILTVDLLKRLNSLDHASNQIQLKLQKALPPLQHAKIAFEGKYLTFGQQFEIQSQGALPAIGNQFVVEDVHSHHVTWQVLPYQDQYLEIFPISARKLQEELFEQQNRCANCQVFMQNLGFWRSAYSQKLYCSNCVSEKEIVPFAALAETRLVRGQMMNTEAFFVRQVYNVPNLCDIFVQQMNHSESLKQFIALRRKLVNYTFQLYKQEICRVSYSESSRGFFDQFFNVSVYKKTRFSESCNIKQFLGTQDYFAMFEQALIIKNLQTGLFAVRSAGYLSLNDIIQHQKIVSLLEQTAAKFQHLQYSAFIKRQSCCCGKRYIGLENECKLCEFCGAIQCSIRCCSQRKDYGQCYVCGFWF